MKKSDLPPGTKVLACVDEEFDYNQLVKYFVNECDYCTLNGTVIDGQASDLKPGPEQVIVSWDDNYLREDEEEIVDINLLTLASDLPAIEKEFKLAMKAVKDKVKEAAKLLEEANTMAVAAHAKSLESLYDATSPLIDVMDASGWRSSSWGC